MPIEPDPEGLRAAEERGFELEDELAVLAGQENRVVARQIGLIAEAIEDDLCVGPDLPVRRWVAWRLGCESNRADKLAAVAERRRDLPVLMGALTEGTVSLDQAAVIARRVPAAFDGEAVRQAEVMRPSQLRRWASTLPPLDDEDDDEDVPARKRHGFSLRPARDDRGRGDWSVSGRLPADVGAALDTAVRAQLDAGWAALKAGERPEPPSTVEALAGVAHAALDHGAAEPGADRDRYRIHLHVDVESELGRFHLGPVVPDSLRRYLTCDATFQAVYEACGRVIGTGRVTRTPNRAMRRAVEHRDAGCRVPGCGSRIVHLHHVVHWADGGQTETWNLIALCPHHHRMHHRGLLDIDGTDADDPAGITFTIAGRTLHERPPPAHAGADPPAGPAYQRPEPGVVPNWALVPPHSGDNGSLRLTTDGRLVPDPNPPPAPEPRPPRPPLDSYGEPWDFPEEIVLDDDED